MCYISGCILNELCFLYFLSHCVVDTVASWFLGCMEIKCLDSRPLQSGCHCHLWQTSSIEGIRTVPEGSLKQVSGTSTRGACGYSDGPFLLTTETKET